MVQGTQRYFLYHFSVQDDISCFNFGLCKIKVKNRTLESYSIYFENSRDSEFWSIVWKLIIRQISFRFKKSRQCIIYIWRIAEKQHRRAQGNRIGNLKETRPVAISVRLRTKTYLKCLKGVYYLFKKITLCFTTDFGHLLTKTLPQFFYLLHPALLIKLWNVETT
jgi:hypothetical protein